MTGAFALQKPKRSGKLLSSAFSGSGGLGSLFFGSFLGLVAGDTLVRVVAGLALDEAGSVEEALNAVGRLGAVRQPVLGAFGVEHDAVFGILGEQRVEGTQLLDEAAVARRTGVSDDDVVEGALLGASAGKAELYGFERDDFVRAVDGVRDAVAPVEIFAQPTRAPEDPYPFRVWVLADGTVTADLGSVAAPRNAVIGDLLADGFEPLVRRAFALREQPQLEGIA